MNEPNPDARASTTPDTPATGPDPRVDRVRGIALSEDWAATIVGQLILAIVLVGLWPGWLVP